MPTSSSTPSTAAPGADSAQLLVPKVPALGRWTAGVILGLALIGAGAAGHWLTRSQQQDQAQAVGEGHAQVEALRRWAVEAAQGHAEPSELGRIQAELSRRADQLGSSGQPLRQAAQLSQGWAAADLGRGQAAVEALPAAFTAWRTADAAVARQTTLTSGTWGTRLDPIRSQLAAIDPSALAHVFDPQAERLELQTQWAQSLEAYAKNTGELARQASQDTALPSTARQALAEWAQRWAAVADQATALAQTAPTRVAAQQWATTVAPLALQASQGTIAAQKSVGWPDWLEWAGLLTAVGSAVILALGLQAQGQARHAEALLGQRRRQALLDLESLAQQLQGLDQAGDTQVQTDARSPARPLATAINRLLATRHALLDEIEQHQGQQGLTLEHLRRNLRDARQLAQVEHHRTEQEGTQRLAVAQAMATLGQQAQRFQHQLHGVVTEVGQANVAVQETSWRNEALREGTQGQAKSLKRLAEGTQGIGVLMDSIQDTARRLSTQAMNTGIEAANLPPTQQSRRLRLRTQEMETLGTTIIQVTQEVIQMLRHIQDDAQGTLKAMEENTTNVVETGTRASAASRALQGLEGTLQALQEAAVRVVDGLEARAVEDAQGAQAANRGRTTQDQLQDQLDQMEQSASELNQQAKASLAAARERLRALPGR